MGYIYAGKNYANFRSTTMTQTNHTFAAYFSGELQTSDWQPVKPFLVLDPFTITIVEP